MRSLSKDEAEAWCLAHGLPCDARNVPARRESAQAFRIPEDTGHRVFLVADHMRRYRDAPEILVWFTEWGVWPSSQRMHVFERFRLSYGETRPLIEIPAFLFSAPEFEDAVSFVTLGVLFLWDTYVAAAKGERLLHYSHDEVGWVAG